MEDFNALAASLAGSVGDVRGALILSRDGLVLGAHPATAEATLKPPWLRFASLGEPDRGFLQFGTEIWSYVRRGAYAAFVVTGVGVRPGLTIDQIEMTLLAAEEARAKRDVLGAEAPAATSAVAPSGKPRTPLHPEPRPAEERVVVTHEAAEAEAATAPEKKPEPRRNWPGEFAQRPPEGGQKHSVWAAPNESKEGDPEGEDEDEFSLASEFRNLLQDGSAGADG